MNITEYVEANGITVAVVRDRGAQVDGDKWEHHAYKLQLRRGTPDEYDFSPTFDWRQGYGIEESPVDRADVVLDALVSDASSYLNARSFEDFAADFGYDSDSRKAEAIYRACGEVLEWLTRFVGGEAAFETLASEVDRI